MGVLIFYILHSALVLFTGRWLLRRSGPHDRGSLVWMIGVSLFVPLVAEAMFVLLWTFNRNKKTSPAYFTNDEAVPFDMKNYQELKDKAVDDFRMMPIMDELNEEDNEVKKDLIIRLIDLDVTQKGKYLRVALDHDDAEVVHYAATTLNVLKDKFIDRIDEGKSRLEDNNSESYLQLTDTYNEYLNSELLNPDMKLLVLKEASGLFEDAVRLFPNKPLFYEHLGNLYLELGQTVQAEAVFKTACSRFPTFCGGYMGLIQAAYKRLDWKAIRHHLALLDEHIPDDQIPERWYPVIRQFKGVG
jgi:tetratricopeptide (TPR) repeat protein